MPFIVEKNIEVIKIHTYSQYQKYPWDKMKDGDSFIIQGYSNKLQNNLSTTGNNWCFRNDKTMKVVVRKEGDNLRVYMIKKVTP
jgi:hypothetical protein